MRWVTFRRNGLSDGEGEDRVGLLIAGDIHALPPGVRLVDLLGDDGERLSQAGERARRDPAEVVPLTEARLQSPIRPPSIRDYSAFEQHVRFGLEAIGQRLGDDWYQIPPFWFCNPNSVVGPDVTIEVPGNSHHMDFELECAAVIGKPGRDIDPAVGEQHIAGFCIMNDWSARDLQHREMACMPIGPSKGKDFGTSLGPWLVTRDEMDLLRKGRSFDLAMTAKVNGRQYSAGNLSDMYWSFGELVAYASRYATLVPGDVLGSGTCGTGCILELSWTHGTEAYPWLEDGDEVVLEIERLGALGNRISRGKEPIPLRPGLS
jgi:2-keto-4-pentenoate hydratase/2-oxohepta-3-ene-1,7-dioic acid hydratase in catechol pathway